MPIEPNKPEIKTPQVQSSSTSQLFWPELLVENYEVLVIPFLQSLQDRQKLQKQQLNLIMKEPPLTLAETWELPIQRLKDLNLPPKVVVEGIKSQQKQQADRLDEIIRTASQSSASQSSSVQSKPAARLQRELEEPVSRQLNHKQLIQRVIDLLNSLQAVQRDHQLKIDSILRERDKANRVILNLRNSASASATLPVSSRTLPVSSRTFPVNSGPSSAASNSSSGQKNFQPELAMRAIQKANRAVSNTTPSQKIYQPDSSMNLRIRDLSSEIQDLKRSKSLQSIQISNLLSHNKSIVKHQQFLTTQVDSLLKAQADLKKQNEGLQKAILSLVSSQEISDSNIDQLRKNQLSIHSVTEKNQDNLEEVREVLWPFLSGSSNSDPESVASGLSSASSGLFGVPRPGSSASILREQDPRVEQSRKRKRSSGQSSDQQLDASF